MPHWLPEPPLMTASPPGRRAPAMTTGTARASNNFDLIRLLAATQVLLYHVLEHLLPGRFERFAELISLFPGVPVFFVTSGFLIAGAWRRSPHARGYFRNRALRIYPALWVCFGVSVLVVLLVFDAPLPPGPFALWSAAQLSVAQFWNPEFLRPYGVGVLNGSLWTIPVELQFYVVLPLLLLGLDRLRWNALVVVALMIALAVANRLWAAWMAGEAGTLAKLYGVSLAPHLFAFMCGVLARRHETWLIPRLRGRVLLLLALYVLGGQLFGALGLTHAGNGIHPVLVVLLAALVLAFAHTRSDVFGRVTGGADLSYGIYIYHMLVVNALLHHDAFGDATNAAVAIVATVALAAASWFLVERPTLSWKRFTTRGPTGAGAAVRRRDASGA